MKCCFYVCLLFCGILCWRQADAQTLYVSALDAGQLPAVTARVYIYDKDWQLQTGFSAADFQVVEDGIDRPVVRFTCESSPLPVPMSAVLTVDVSGSMNWPLDDPNTERIEVARQAGMLWVDEWPDDWDCAITSFNSRASVVRDFTTDKVQLRQGVISLRPEGGTNYAAAFLDKKAGAVTLADRAKNKPVIVLLTDGQSQDPYSANDIITKAKAVGAVVYCICLGMTASPDLKKIALETGGLCYDRVNSSAELMEVYRRVIDIVLNIKPCSITWQTEHYCTLNRQVEISLPSRGLSTQTSYMADRLKIPYITVDPVGVEFGFVPPGTTQSTTISIQAGSLPVTITNIRTSTTAIHTEPIAFPFTLTAGQKRTLAVRFTPTDSAQMYADLTLEGTLCHGNVVQFTGGFPGILSAAPTLALLSPNGGEVLPVGKKTDITWKGTLPDDTLTLAYSIDGGNSWTQITDKATNSSYEWIVPNTPSTTCVMQITFNPSPNSNAKSDTTLYYHDKSVTAVDFKTNALLASSDETGIIKFMDTPDIELNTTTRTYDVRYSPDEKLLAVATGNEAQIWDNVSGALLQTLQHGLIVYTAEFDPTSKRVLTASGDETAKLWNVETGIKLLSLHPDNAGIVFCGCFDVTGNRLYTGHEDGSFAVWNAVTGAQDKTIHAHNEAIYSIDNNPADNTIATGSRDGSVKIWNTITGNLVTTFVAEDTEVRSIAYDPTGRLLAAGCEDGTVKIWDVAKKELALTLIAHGDIVTDVSFAPDGLHLATASFDSTVKIWDVRYRGVMSDSSDAFWTIAAPLVKAKDIDFGDVYVSSSKDSIVNEFLANEGIIPAQIDSVRISGLGRNAFASDLNLEAFELPAGSRQNVGFRFTPPAVGVYEARLAVYYHGAYGQYTLRGRGIRPPVELLRKEIDFGRVKVSTSKDTTDFILRNVSTAPVTVEAVNITEPNADLFSIQSAVTPFVLQPNEEYVVSLRFSPVALGSASSQLVLQCSNVPFPLSIGLFGTGIEQTVIDMGPPAEFAIACSQESTWQLLQVVNPYTNASVTITGVNIEGVHAVDFSITSGADVPIVIAPGGTQIIGIRCQPAQPGIRQAELVLDAESAMGQSIFFRQLYAVKDDTLTFELSTSSVQLKGLREFEEKRDSVGILNTSAVPMPIDVPHMIGGFAIDSVVPNPIPPGGSGFLYLRYTGGAQGTIELQHFTSEQACSTIAIDLFASVQQWPSVLAGSVAIETLAFPPLLCAEQQRDTTLTLHNTGHTPVTITSINTSGPHAADFSLTIPDDLTLAELATITLPVRFTPSASGIRTATISFTTSVNDSTFTLPISGRRSQPDFNIASTLDMGMVKKVVSTTAVLELLNTGDVPITWEIPSDDGYFSVVSITPATARPGEVSEVTVQFSGAATETMYTGTLVFVHPCGTDKSVAVQIEVSDIPVATARVGTAQGSPGDIITVPVYLDSPADLAGRGVEYCTSTLHFNASLLVPVGSTPAGTVSGGERSIPLVIPVHGTPGAPAVELRFSVALGNDTATLLCMDSVVAVGGTLFTRRTNGSFTLTGICREGGIRLFDGAIAAGLSAPTPSPAQEKTNVTYSLVEAGQTSMTITDMLGRTTAELFSGMAIPGVYELSIPTHHLSGGTYFLILRTPTQMFTRQLHIAK